MATVVSPPFADPRRPRPTELRCWQAGYARVALRQRELEQARGVDREREPSSIHSRLAVLACTAALATSCGEKHAGVEKCTAVPGDPAPDSLRQIGCQSDFLALASVPLSITIPGARSVKVVLDTFDGTLMDQLYFQNSVKFQIHYEFAMKHLSRPDHTLVPSLSQFNQTEYYAPENQRRFLLGAVTHYEGPDVWTVEVAPYDTATPAMIERLFNKVKGAVFFKNDLYFHPTSEDVEARAKELPASIKMKTTDEIFAGTAYQPLNLGTTNTDNKVMSQQATGANSSRMATM